MNWFRGATMWEGYIGRFQWGIPYWSFLRTGAPVLIYWGDRIIISKAFWPRPWDVR